MISLLLLATLGHAASLRATVEVGPEGPVLVDAVVVAGDVRARPGPLEVLGPGGEPLATASVPDPRVRSIILPEGGGATAVLERARIRVEVPWPDGARSLRLGDRVLMPMPAPDPVAVPVQASGPDDERLDLVFLGDGYTEAELDAFAEDVDQVVDHLATIEPYGSYAGLFNIWRVDVASPESGASHAESDPPVTRETAFECTYGCGGIDRLVCCDDARVLDVLGSAVPGADGVMVLVNDPTYGGSGGFTYAASYTGDDYGVEVAAHELGHSLVGLWDEYSYGVSGSGTGAPNCGEDAEHWAQWLDEEEVDAFPVCSYTNLVRPTENGCMMRTLQDDYCPVCREQTVLAIYGQLPALIVSTDPPAGEVIALTGREGQTFSVDALGPATGLEIDWTLDGETVGSGSPFTLACGEGGEGGELVATVTDTTPFVRIDPEGLLLDEARWTVEPCERRFTCGCAAGGGAPGILGLLLLPLVRRRRAA